MTGQDITALAAKILPLQSQENDSRWEWARTRPEFKNKQLSALHECFLEQTVGDTSFKPYLYRHTPQYREYAKDKGVDIAAFWNLSDPQQTGATFQRLIKNTDISRGVEIEFTRTTGLSFAELDADPELVGVMSDQLVASVKYVRNNTLAARTDPSELLNRLTDQALDAISARKPQRKLRPVINFLDSQGITAATTPNAILEQLRDEDVRSRIILAIQERQDQKDTEIAFIMEPL